MADMMGAEEAKQILGCDDATLSNYINNGTIRASRDANNQIMVLREDVQNLVGATASDSDDGTIVLSGDSEDLSIDLGEVVDSEAVTMVQTASEDSNAEPITFGDELEVVNFDDGRTEDLSFEDASQTENLSFTEQNTAVITDVDQTAVGTTDDFQTVDYDDDSYPDEGRAPSGRRSVRSQRVRHEAPKTHWIWPVLLVLTTIVLGFFIAPFFYLEMTEYSEDEVGYGEHGFMSTYRYRGAKDGFYTDLAGNIAGFSIEPDQEKWQANHEPGEEYIPISTNHPNQPYTWRYEEFLGKYKTDDDGLRKRWESWVIDEVEEEEDPEDPNAPRKPVSAKAFDSKTGDPLGTYPVTDAAGGGDVTTYQPVISD